MLALALLALAPLLDHAVYSLPGLRWNISFKVMTLMPVLVAVTLAQLWLCLAVVVRGRAREVGVVGLTVRGGPCSQQNAALFATPLKPATPTAAAASNL